MRKNIFIALTIITGVIISITSCLLGDDIETIEQKALKANYGITAVNIADIHGVTALADNVPVTNIIGNEQYTGTVKWLPEDKTFRLNVKYTATITLTAKPGYTFKTLKANFFTVNGTESTANSKGSGVISVEFPPAKYGISKAAIEGITVPSPGGIPVRGITNNSQYKGDVTWSPAVERTFVRNVRYTAAITLTPNSDYTLQGIAADFFTVAGAESVIFNAKSGVVTAVFPPAEPAMLTQGVWTDGNISTYEYGVEQWFKFTASSNSTHYIHADFGTMNSSSGFYIQVYDSTYSTILSQTRLYDNNRYISLSSLTSWQTYYIKVTSSNTGTYRITFNTSSTPPLLSNSATATTLTAGVWADGTISANGEQWFKFTAASSNTHYIHAGFGTLNSSSGFNVQVYSSTGSTIVSQTRLYNSNKNTSQSSVIYGQTYYIRVTRVTQYSDNTGTYQIAFNTSDTPPLLSNSATATTLTFNEWADGTISTNGEQWFKFTADSSSTHYIHAEFGTLDSSYGFNVQVYSSTGSTIVSQTRLYNSNKHTSQSSVTSGQTYYIRVTPYSGNTGTYQILFCTSSTPPLPNNSATAVTLTAGIWADGTISANGEQWFKFTADSSNTHYIHAEFGTLNSSYGFNVQVYSSTGSTVAISKTQLNSSNRSTYSSNLTSGQTYYIRVTPSGNTGTYQILFNTSSTPPLPSNSATAATLIAGVWADGTISANGEQWFKFTATSSSTHYIHAGFNTLNSSNGFNVQVYSSTGSTVKSQTRLYYSTRYTSLSPVTSEQTYYIRVTPYSSGYTGTYWITFNTSTISPSLPVSVTIEMYDSNGDGLNGNGFLNIDVGVNIHYVLNFSVGSSWTKTINVTTGDEVKLYWGSWGSGSNPSKNSFIVYYTNTPPSPSFNPNSWSGSNALVYRLYNTMGSISDGTLLGSFTVP